MKESEMDREVTPTAHLLGTRGQKPGSPECRLEPWGRVTSTLMVPKLLPFGLLLGLCREYIKSDSRALGMPECSITTPGLFSQAAVPSGQGLGGLTEHSCPCYLCRESASCYCRNCVLFNITILFLKAMSYLVSFATERRKLRIQDSAVGFSH